VAAALAEAEKRRRSEIAFLKREKELKAQLAAERMDMKQQLHDIDINRHYSTPYNPTSELHFV
jgi:hypothetical protein